MWRMALNGSLKLQNKEFGAPDGLILLGVILYLNLDCSSVHR